MKTTFTILLLLFFLPAFCQIKFEKGYIIDFSDIKIDCFINNLDWNANPKNFQYKLLETDKNSQQGNLSNVKEFKVENYPKYVRSIVDIDRSATLEVKNFSHSINPVWEKDTIFLRTVVDGKTALYVLEDGLYLRNFFFKSSIDSTIRQLIFKEYFLNDAIAKNNYYKQQLMDELECKTCPQVFSYTEKELKKYFTAYNKSIGENDVTNETKTILTRDAFNLKLTPGFNYSSLSLNFSPNGAKKFKSDFFFRMGLEIEFILPFNKNKWAIFIEPTYQYIKTNTLEDANSEALISLQSIGIPIGIRHYFFLNDRNKLFVNAQFMISELNFIVGKSLLSSGTSNYSYANSPNLLYNDSFGFGVGYTNKRFSIETRYILNQKIGDGSYYDANYKIISIILGYKFLNIKSKLNR